MTARSAKQRWRFASGLLISITLMVALPRAHSEDDVSRLPQVDVGGSRIPGGFPGGGGTAGGSCVPGTPGCLSIRPGERSDPGSGTEVAKVEETKNQCAKTANGGNPVRGSSSKEDRRQAAGEAVGRLLKTICRTLLCGDGGLRGGTIETVYDDGSSQVWIIDAPGAFNAQLRVQETPKTEPTPPDPARAQACTTGPTPKA